MGGGTTNAADMQGFSRPMAWLVLLLACAVVPTLGLRSRGYLVRPPGKSTSRSKRRPSDTPTLTVHPVTPAAQASRGGSHRRSHWAALVSFAVAGGMVPWVVFLGITLPRRYAADNWDVLWTGFDVAMVLVLCDAAWTAWFRGRIRESTTLIAGTLMTCDAWFDIVPSLGRSDQWVSMLTGFGAEIPLAVYFFWLYSRRRPVH
jgi:hypothetical protein